MTRSYLLTLYVLLIGNSTRFPILLASLENELLEINSLSYGSRTEANDTFLTFHQAILLSL